MNIRWVLGILTASISTLQVACGSDAAEPSSSSGASTSNGTGGATAGSGGSGTTTGGSSSTGGSVGSSGSSSTTGGSSTTSGGSTGSTEACAPAADACSSADAMQTLPISDFENGMGWYLFANPDDVAGTTDPVAGSNILAAEISCPTGGLCGSSSFAMHVSGAGFTSYGPSLSSDYVYKDGDEVIGMPVDVSTYTGVAFWARKGDTAGAAPTLKLTINDVNSHELGGVCDPAAMPGSEAEPSDACWDGWATERALPSTWTLIKVPFSALAQNGFGKAAEAIDTTQVYGLSFQMPNMATFDFWIDDVAFYKE